MANVLPRIRGCPSNSRLRRRHLWQSQKRLSERSVQHNSEHRSCNREHHRRVRCGPGNTMDLLRRSRNTVPLNTGDVNTPSATLVDNRKNLLEGSLRRYTVPKMPLEYACI